VTDPSRTGEPCSIKLPYGQLAGLRWHDSQQPRVLALHGWLDNAASFIPLAEHLKGLDLVALDFPGHGHSDWWPAGHFYHFVDYLWPVLDVADQLGWQQFHLLGHSLGGAVATMLAAALPERILTLNAIESFGPLTTRAGDTRDNLRRALQDRNTYLGRELHTYQDIESATAARAKHGDLSRPAAELLVRRNLKQTESGWQWRSDPRLRRTSLFRFTQDQVMDLLSRLAVPTTLILAEKPIPEPWHKLRDQQLATLPDCTISTLPGHHHLHMESPRAVAEVIMASIRNG